MNSAWKAAREAGDAKLDDFRAFALSLGGTDWPELLSALRIETPDAGLNFLADGFLQAQALDARVRGRTGMYQPGGAWGFRDQLQDLIALMHWQPERMRAHLLRCAARQFEAGDVLHWWHEPYSGVRTHISDDLLFLPWATARYVSLTGDRGVLFSQIPWLEDVPTPAHEATGEARDASAETRPGEAVGCASERADHAVTEFVGTVRAAASLAGGADFAKESESNMKPQREFASAGQAEGSDFAKEEVCDSELQRKSAIAVRTEGLRADRATEVRCSRVRGEEGPSEMRVGRVSDAEGMSNSSGGHPVQERPVAEDIYADMRPSTRCASLHEHCMRAIRRAARTGAHGLCRMGGGDWNDGMNRVGGESVWLTEFLAVVASEYAEVAPDKGEKDRLNALAARLKEALEENAWDGAWYLRAFAWDGRKLGGRECSECRIDLISQAWAVLAGLDAARCESAMNEAWLHLVDERLGVVKLLDPPFDGDGFDPGYIAAYPPGIRENGAQYTHAACWYLCALIRQGDAARAHRVLQMLLPLNHARDEAGAMRYRVEPYAMAADIYTNPSFEGRGGWTWYSGSAGWMLQAILSLLGYERRGERVRLCALLGDWPEAGVSLRWGESHYQLISRRGISNVTLDGEKLPGDSICLVDDGKVHRALFPAR